MKKYITRKGIEYNHFILSGPHFIESFINKIDNDLIRKLNGLKGKYLTIEEVQKLGIDIDDECSIELKFNKGRIAVYSFDPISKELYNIMKNKKADPK